MSKVILTRGIQGCGKSTFAKEWVLEDPEHRVRVSRDDIRNMSGKYWVPSREKYINDVRNSIIEDAVKHNYDIIIDEMHLKQSSITEDIRLIKSFSILYTDFEIKDFSDVPLEECIRRNNLRTGDAKIAEFIIKRCYNTLINENNTQLN